MVDPVSPHLSVNYHVQYTTSQYTSYYGPSINIMPYSKLSLFSNITSQNTSYYGCSISTMHFSRLSHPITSHTQLPYTRPTMVPPLLPCYSINCHIPYNTSQNTSYYGFSSITMPFSKLSHSIHHFPIHVLLWFLPYYHVVQ